LLCLRSKIFGDVHIQSGLTTEVVVLPWPSACSRAIGRLSRSTIVVVVEAMDRCSKDQ
jgi:hypothetical protein